VIDRLKVRVLHPLLHRAANAAVHLARETLRWAYIGAEDGARLGFAGFGADTMLEQPHAVLVGAEFIDIGSDTLISAGAILAAWPESDEVVEGGPFLRIGSRVWAARGLSIVAHRSVEIGDDVWFGPGVYITDAGHDASDLERPIGLQMEPAEPVRIGAGSWIGTGVVILPGVTIGEHVAVGANSVVTGDLPSNTIAVGSPAKVVRHLDAHLDAEGMPDSRP